MRIGIVGGGQLGRMLALSAHRLGLEPLVVDPKADCPAAAVARTITAPYADPEVVAALGRTDVVTYEFESAPQGVLRRLAECVPVRPEPSALAATADRLREKRMLRRLGVPTPRFRPVDSEDDLRDAAAALGLPAVLKTRRLGYDGRGQRRLEDPDDAAHAWRALGEHPLVLEEFVAFDREVSLVAVRTERGSVHFWDPTENRHVDGILRISRAPAPDIAPTSLQRAQEAVAAILEHLRYVGVLVVEFFVCGEDWIVNELACRVHNSGHWTIEGAVTSQFENHLRAITGLPVGSTRCLEPCAMINVIGESPPAADVLAIPGARLHAYGKAPAPGRKLQHVTLSAPTVAETDQRLETLVHRLGDPALLAALEGGRPFSGEGARTGR